MILCTRPTKAKHFPEIKLLSNLRMAALVAGDKVSQSSRVQLCSAQLLKHIISVMPSPEFIARHMNQAGELGDGLILHVDHNMSMVTIRKVNTDNVVSLHKICVSTINSGGVQ